MDLYLLTVHEVETDSSKNIGEDEDAEKKGPELIQWIHDHETPVRDFMKGQKEKKESAKEELKKAETAQKNNKKRRKSSGGILKKLATGPLNILRPKKADFDVSCLQRLSTQTQNLQIPKGKSIRSGNLVATIGHSVNESDDLEMVRMARKRMEEVNVQNESSLQEEEVIVSNDNGKAVANPPPKPLSSETSQDVNKSEDLL